MNIWISKLGPVPFSAHDLQLINHSASHYLNKKISINYQYKTGSVHYVSVCPEPDQWKKNYHFESDNLVGFSGLIVGNGSKDIDFRKAEHIASNIDHLHDISRLAGGQFSLFKASENKFDCIVDNLGSYKVFYYQDNGHTLVSNHPKFINLFKEREPNVEFYVNYIAASGTYGIETDEKEVFVLPEFGWLHWTKQDGLTVKRYKNLSEMIQPEGTYEHLLHQTATHFKGAASYLNTYHETALSLSGGFDSRLALHMFWGLANKKIHCYSFPDNKFDVKLAKLTAEDHGVSHVLLKPAESVSVEDMDDYFERVLAPYSSYDNIAGYSFRNNFEEIFWNKQTVVINGNGGDIDDYGLKKFKTLHNLNEKHAIEAVVKKVLVSEILNPEGFDALYTHLKEHYETKYLPFMIGKGNDHKLRLFYFILERFGSYQGYKFFIDSYARDLFLPFANIDFIKTSFCQSRKELPRKNKSSFHHDLSLMLTNGEEAAIPFTSALHWNASKAKRIQNRLKAKINNTIKPFLRKSEKYSFIQRIRFYEKNKSHYKEVLYSYPNSGLWDFIDQKKILDQFQELDSKKGNYNGAISKIVPILKSGV